MLKNKKETFSFQFEWPFDLCLSSFRSTTQTSPYKTSYDSHRTPRHQQYKVETGEHKQPAIVTMIKVDMFWSFSFGAAFAVCAAGRLKNELQFCQSRPLSTPSSSSRSFLPHRGSTSSGTTQVGNPCMSSVTRTRSTPSYPPSLPSPTSSSASLGTMSPIGAFVGIERSQPLT